MQTAIELRRELRHPPRREAHSASSRSDGSARPAHALREVDTPNADPARLKLNSIFGPKSAAEVVASFRSRTLPLLKRKDAVRCVEFLVAASPEFMHSMDRNAQEAYFKDSLKWISALFGGDDTNIVFAAVHRDEMTPHMQVLVTPIVDGRLAANKVLGGPPGLVKMQDEFASKVGAKYKMRRGERGSRAKHTSVRSFYAAIEAAGSMDALPERVLVPPAPEPLGIWASAADKKAHAAAAKAREVACEASRRRRMEIERLAGLALATHGRGRRRLPARLSNAEALIKEGEVAKVAIRRATELLASLSASQHDQVRRETTEEMSKHASTGPTDTTPAPAGRPARPRPR